MLLALLCALLLAPVFWLAVPPRWQREGLLLASLGGLAVLDPRLLVLVGVVSLGVYASVRVIATGRVTRPWRVVVPGLALLVLLFGGNKLGGAAGLLPSQGGLVLLGVSYLVLKAAAVLIDAARGRLREADFLDVLAWIVFLPTYTSGPIEEFDHFRSQTPRADVARVLGGLERILFGLVKTLVFSYHLGEWATPLLADPASQTPGMLLLAAYAVTLRFYFDFSGYSDLAIGVAAWFGIEIQENFDHPLTRRNLAQLWQHWHMTLTAWLRRYLFMPISRSILGRGGVGRDTFAMLTAQGATMTFCGLWHGLGWNFLIWGLLQAVGLVWVGRPARSLGRHLPAGLRSFWRDSWIGYGLSTLVTFHYFALSSILVFTGIDGARAYAVRLLGLG